MSRLLENAVLSIELGIEDFNNEDKRRLVSSIRNTYAGLLLFCKHVLFEKSPPDSDGVLIYKTLLPVRLDGGEIGFKPEKVGKNTIDRDGIRRRLTSLGVNLNWQAMEEIARHRNQVEHFFSESPQELVREALAKSYVLITQLSTSELEKNPEELFRNDHWQQLLELHNVFEQQRARAVDSFSSVEWSSAYLADAVEFLRCGRCEATLVEQTDPTNTVEAAVGLRCIACTTDLDRDDALEAALGDATRDEAFIAVTQGGSAPIAVCPSCERESFVRGEGQCAICNFDGREMVCNICGEFPDPEDYDIFTGNCSYCNHQIRHL